MLSSFCPLTPVPRILCARVERAAPPESCGGPWAYLQLLDHYTYHFPYEALEVVATAIENFLSSGDEQTLGDRNELQEAYRELQTYQEFKPNHFARQRINAQLRTLQLKEGA